MNSKSYENEVYLNNIKKMYSSYNPLLNNLTIEDNSILKFGKEYIVHLNNVLLSQLNPKIFLLEPNYILNIIYMIELIYSNSIDDYKKDFVRKYTEKYLKLTDAYKDNKNVEDNALYCFSIPIFISYDEKFNNTPCSDLIKSIINDHDNKITNDTNGAYNKGNALKLIKEGYIPQEDDPSISNSGFATIFIIIGTILLISFYMLYFILNS